jgi:hypothetical protein
MPHGRVIWKYGRYTPPNHQNARLPAWVISRLITQVQVPLRPPHTHTPKQKAKTNNKEQTMQTNTKLPNNKQASNKQRKQSTEAERQPGCAIQRRMANSHRTAYGCSSVL